MSDPPPVAERPPASEHSPAPGRPRVVMLVGRGESSSVVYHAIADVADVVSVLVEDPPPRGKLLRRRAKRLGIWTVLDQVLFLGIVPRLLRWRSGARIDEIRARFGMDPRAIPEAVIERVSSVNARRVRERLVELGPDLVVVNGTRIISRRVLTSISVPFLNTHAGITPAYRGVHGAYWALAQGRPELAGVTVHLVDPGVDTGGVLAQVLIEPGRDDNYITYPVLQLGRALEPLRAAILETSREGPRRVEPLSTESAQYYHPGLCGYLWRRWRRGVR